jgi:hypothetical protein
MSGAALDEVFGSSILGSPTTAQNPWFPLIYGGRPIPSNRSQDARDLSGSVLYQIEENQMLMALKEDLPTLGQHAEMLHDIVNEYKSLKETDKILSKELELVESNIKTLETTQQAFVNSLEDFKLAVFHGGILSNSEFDELQQKNREIREIQVKAMNKCLDHYKKRAMELHEAIRKIQMNSMTYLEFIKTGVKAMTNPDVKISSCSVCFEAEISHCLTPCGHTFCEGCIKKSGGEKCMTCRTPIQKTVKIFF